MLGRTNFEVDRRLLEEHVEKEAPEGWSKEWVGTVYPWPTHEMRRETDIPRATLLDKAWQRKLLGKEIRFEHNHEWVLGMITGVGAHQDTGSVFVFFRINITTIKGRLINQDIVDGKIRGLSMAHYANTKAPVEVSVCFVGRRPDCYIINASATAVGAHDDDDDDTIIVSVNTFREIYVTNSSNNSLHNFKPVISMSESKNSGNTTPFVAADSKSAEGPKVDAPAPTSAFAAGGGKGTVSSKLDIERPNSDSQTSRTGMPTTLTINNYPPAAKTGRGRTLAPKAPGVPVPAATTTTGRGGKVNTTQADMNDEDPDDDDDGDVPPGEDGADDEEEVPPPANPKAAAAKKKNAVSKTKRGLNNKRTNEEMDNGEFKEDEAAAYTKPKSAKPSDEDILHEFAGTKGIPKGTRTRVVALLTAKITESNEAKKRNEAMQLEAKAAKEKARELEEKQTRAAIDELEAKMRTSVPKSRFDAPDLQAHMAKLRQEYKSMSPEGIVAMSKMFETVAAPPPPKPAEETGDMANLLRLIQGQNRGPTFTLPTGSSSAAAAAAAAPVADQPRTGADYIHQMSALKGPEIRQNAQTFLMGLLAANQHLKDARMTVQHRPDGGARLGWVHKNSGEAAASSSSSSAAAAAAASSRLARPF